MARRQRLANELAARRRTAETEQARPSNALREPDRPQTAESLDPPGGRSAETALSASSTLSMSEPARGQLRVFLGMAAGVGKTFRMLVEGHAEQEAGRDVVIGLLESHGRADTAEARRRATDDPASPRHLPRDEA